MLHYFTAAEASAVTGRPIRNIRKALDVRTIPAKTRSAGTGRAKRYVSEPALVCLRLEQTGLSQLPLSLRRKIFKLVCKQPDASVLRPVAALQIDVELARKEVRQKLAELREAEEMIVADPGILGGVPVFRGTRIPVHAIASMLAQGSSVRELAKGYPSLTARAFELARVYAQAHPRQGRPKSALWKRQPAVQLISYPLDDAE